jgi:uncharacterized damage-inducible protein DinB
MHDPEHFARFFDTHQWILNEHAKGITHEESCRAPAGGGNSLNWVLGHIAASRNDIHALIGVPPAWSEEKAAPYLRGSSGVVEGAVAQPVSEILERLERSTETIKARLAEMPLADFERRLEKGTVGERLAFLQFHESYHAGQVGLLRRLLGKQGVIS